MSWARSLVFAAGLIPSAWDVTAIYTDSRILGLVSSAWFVEGTRQFNELPIVKSGQCSLAGATHSEQELCVTDSVLISWLELEGGSVLSVSRRRTDWQDLFTKASALHWTMLNDSTEIRVSVRETSLGELHADLLSQGLHKNWQLLLNDKTSEFMVLSWKQSNGDKLTQSAHFYSSEHVVLSEIRGDK